MKQGSKLQRLADYQREVSKSIKNHFLIIFTLHSQVKWKTESKKFFKIISLLCRTLASSGKDLRDPFLKALAQREEANRSGKMTVSNSITIFYFVVEVEKCFPFLIQHCPLRSWVIIRTFVMCRMPWNVRLCAKLNKKKKCKIIMSLKLIKNENLKSPIIKGFLSCVTEFLGSYIEKNHFI